MKHPSRLKKILKRTVLLLATGVLITIVLLYYFVVVRFKDGLRFVVAQETKGKYVFDAGTAEFSLRHRSIVLKESTIRCRDTSGADVYCDIRIPEMYFSLASWKELVLHKKVVADSFCLVQAGFSLHERAPRARRPSNNFRPGDILTLLNGVLARFNARSFSLRDASFTWNRAGAARPLEVRNINLAISNFTKVNSEDSHLLGSDKISCSLGRQQWSLPDGQEISFRSMNFTSEGQRFQIDSFTYLRSAASDKGEMMIYADQFLFNSRHLPAVYQKEQLLIDTLICRGPVLTLPSGEKSDKNAAREVRSELFRLINVKYIEVTGGSLQLKGNDGRQLLASRQTNLSISNLDIDPARARKVRVDSIRMALQQLTFLSKDSLWQLDIASFSLSRDGVLFKDVSYGPTPGNHLSRHIAFRAPSLELKEVNLGALLGRQLVAADAVLYRPEIMLYDNRRQQRSAAPAVARRRKDMGPFYQALHALNQIIMVQNFTIADGRVLVHTAGKKGPLDLSAEQLNARILLHQLFRSDSLVDIKHSIPDLRIGALQLSSGAMKLKVDSYRLDGINRRNRGAALDVTLANGTTLHSRDIYWEVFDWDVYQRSKEIQVDYLRLGSLSAVVKGKGKEEQHAARPPLPVIRIGRLAVDTFAVESTAPSLRLQCHGGRLHTDHFRTAGHAFLWDKAEVFLHDIGVQNDKIDGRVGQVNFSNQRESVIRALTIDAALGAGRADIRLPVVRADLPLHSSDFSQLDIPVLSLDDGVVSLHQTNGSDTLVVSAHIDLDAADISLVKHRNPFLQARAASLALQHASVRKGAMALDLPHALLQISRGRVGRDEAGKLLFASAADLEWNGLSAVYRKDSNSLAVSEWNGRLHIPLLSSAGLKAKDSWKSLLDGLYLEKGQIAYKGKTLSAAVANTCWNPQNRTLKLEGVKAVPIKSREETFQTAQWQGDYIVMNGRTVTLAGIDPGNAKDDSLLTVRKLSLDSVVLDVSRDKRVPFQHGIEKLMPTRLIRSLSIPLLIDTVAFANSAVTYHELTANAPNWSSVPIRDLRGRMLHVSSRECRHDTLDVWAAGHLFNGQIEELSYKESYADSLSGFAASLQLLPVDLPVLGQMAMPSGRVTITSGRTDTVRSRWQGNKYAAYGSMHFFYEDLRIGILNRNRSGSKGLLPAAETWLANLVLPDDKRKPSLIFFERDRERFVFNYWIKTQIRGLLSTMGIKKDRAYRRQYRNARKRFGLPETMPVP